MSRHPQPLRRRPILGALQATLLLVVACAHPRAPRPVPPQPTVTADPARRANKPLVLITMPDAPSFQAVRRSLVNEISRDLDVVTKIVTAETTPAQFTARLESSGAALVVLMDNPTVKLYREYQKRAVPGARPVPAIIVMSSFLEDVQADLRNSSGIAYEVPGVTAFVKLRSIIARPVARVGVVHRPAFHKFLERQKTLAAKENITLVPARVPAEATAADVKRALARLRRSGDLDALWVLNDIGLIKDSKFVEAAWRKETALLDVPIVVGVPSLVSAAASFGIFAVLPDLDALGVQAANLVMEVAEGQWQAAAHPVELPVSTLTVVNVRQCREKFGLRPDASRRIDQAIE